MTLISVGLRPGRWAAGYKGRGNGNAHRDLRSNRKGSEIMKLTGFLLCLSLAVAFGVTAAGAQNRFVYFSQNPTANRCTGFLYPLRLNLNNGDFILLQPREKGEVIRDATAVSLHFKSGQYFPASDAQIDPGAICFFGGCQDVPKGSILLTCGGPWPEKHVLFIRSGASRK
jgi:hypothetical protein